jgi:hypothetical protein
MFCAPFIKHALVHYALCLEIVNFPFVVQRNKPLGIAENANIFCVNAIVCSYIIKASIFFIKPIGMNYLNSESRILVCYHRNVWYFNI